MQKCSFRELTSRSSPSGRFQHFPSWLLCPSDTLSRHSRRQIESKSYRNVPSLRIERRRPSKISCIRFQNTFSRASPVCRCRTDWRKETTQRRYGDGKCSEETETRRCKTSPRTWTFEVASRQSRSRDRPCTSQEGPSLTLRPFQTSSPKAMS